MTNETMIETETLVPALVLESVPAAPEAAAENAAITSVALMPALTAEARAATTAQASPIDLSTAPGPEVVSAGTSPPIDFAPPRPPEMRPWFSA